MSKKKKKQKLLAFKNVKEVHLKNKSCFLSRENEKVKILLFNFIIFLFLIYLLYSQSTIGNFLLPSQIGSPPTLKKRIAPTNNGASQASVGKNDVITAYNSLRLHHDRDAFRDLRGQFAREEYPADERDKQHDHLKKNTEP